MSPDLPERIGQTIDRLRITYQILSDSTMAASRAFGIAFRLDDARYEESKRLGADLEEVSGEKHHHLPVPSVFMCNAEGIILFEYVNPNYNIRLSPPVLLAAATATVK